MFLLIEVNYQMQQIWNKNSNSPPLESVNSDPYFQTC